MARSCHRPSRKILVQRVCLFLCERTCLSVRKGYKNKRSSARDRAERSCYYLVVSLCYEHNLAQHCRRMLCADSEWRLPLPTCAGRVLCIHNHSSRGMSVGGRGSCHQKCSSTVWAVDGLRPHYRWGWLLRPLGRSACVSR